MKNRKSVFKVIFSIIVGMLVISAIYNMYAFFTRGKQVITVKASSTYYTGSDICATVSVKNAEENKLIDAKITAQLYDKDNKKVKGVKGTYDLDKGENASISLEVPKEIETGNYSLKITSKSGLLKDTADLSLNIINDVKSNVIISLDKGIYKPGDEVNFRALILSKKENLPVQNDVSIYIYDGNNNKVYSNTTKTSEYGIVSGSFKLADEVNSGTYKISVLTETQEMNKTFTVNPYITPKFEMAIATDKENYLVGETAQITVSGKYFFGEPVKGAEVKGTIDGRDVVGFTNDEGNFETLYKIEQTGKINLEFSLTDTSNYMIETSKTIAVGTDFINVDFVPEYGEIAIGVDNDIYIVTKNIDGTPIKTYSTISNEEISKQVISDENGIGKVTLTKQEIISLGVLEPNTEFKVVTEDMEGNKIENNFIIPKNNNYDTLIKTDKVKYNTGDDIEISLNSRYDLENNIYVLKNNELIKTISTSEQNVIINLEQITGLVDIIVSSKMNRGYPYVNSISNITNYSKRTIFIKPNNNLNIGIETDLEEYKPGDTLNVTFTTKNEKNENVNAALLVSILDEAVLSLAENDLSIDNIKLALEDITLTEGVSAADVYAMVLDEKSDIALTTLLLKQENSMPNIINRTYVNNSSDNLLFGVFSAIIGISFISIYILTRNEKIRKFAKSIFVPIVNVIAIFALISMYLTEFIYDYIYSGSDFVIILGEIILSIILYLLFLYKERDLIFKMVKEYAVLPGCIVLIGNLMIEIIYDIGEWRYSEVSERVTIFGIFAYLIIFTILIAVKRKKELKGKIKNIYNICLSVLKAFAFWGIIFVLSGIFDEVAIIIAIIGYVFFKKIIFKETKTKMNEGKIVLNLTVSEIVGMIAGGIMIVIMLVMLGLYITNLPKSTVTDSMQSNGAFETINPSTSLNGEINFGYAATDSAVKGESSTSNDTSSNFDINSFIPEINMNFEKTEEITQETNNLENDKETKTEENIRNIFLESLAFLPEVITENGIAKLDLKISDNITTWNIQTIGNTKQGNVGYNSGTFKVFKEFFVDFSLPTNSVVTDKVSIPVTVYNYTENVLTINVDVKENEWAKIDSYDKVLEVQAQSTGMIYVPIEILKDGNNTLRVEATNGSVSDIVEKTMNVKPNGLEKNEVVSSGIIEENYSQDVIFNEQAIDGTQKLKIKLYPSPVAQAIENIDSMLKLPTGCFEQTSSSLYPDILVLKYLRKNELSNPELEEKALSYINTGYQKLLTYEVQGKKGGYSLYGNSPAEPVITAFGLMEMNELSDVYQIDENVVENMKEYLFGVQKVNGSFDYKSTYIGGAATTDDIAMNAYIIWALSEVVPDDKRLEKSIEYLKNKMDEVSDGYTLALIANVFANTDNKNLANEIIKQINNDIQHDYRGTYINSKISDYYGTRGIYQNVQTTALMSIALTKLESNTNTNSEFIKYLISQKDFRGSWGTTQGTILALKAINDYSEKTDIKNQTIIVKVNGEEKKIEIKEDSLNIYEFEFENVQTENNFEIQMKKGNITYEVIKSYYQAYDEINKENNNETDNKIVLMQNINNVAKVNDVITQSIYISNSLENIENGLIEVNIPQGCTPIEESLLTLKYNGLIEKYEYNYGKINLYLRNFNEGENITLDIEYRALYPEKVTAVAIRFYDYYNPDIEAICLPVELEITE